MKVFIIYLLCFWLASCLSQSNESTLKDDALQETINPAQSINAMGTMPSVQNEITVKYQYKKDNKSGLIVYRCPLPSNWILHQEANATYMITGPDGIRVGQTQTEQYAYAQDAFSLQSMQMAGQQIAPVYSLEQIVELQLKPSSNSLGYSFITSYPLHGVKAMMEKFDAGMVKTGSQRSFTALGTEWKGPNDSHSLIILVQSVIRKGTKIIWNLQTTELEAPANRFDYAKRAYLHAVDNIEINPQWQQYMNGKLMGQIRQNDALWAARSRQRAQAHQHRMAAIQTRGNSSRSVAQIYSEISDISHAGYLKRSDINSAGHSRTVDMIHERTVIGNHGTGEHYYVPSGNDYYWVNKNGEYFGTDNPLYDPRIDNRINGSGWSKFEIEK